ncbi:hypothetical protein F2Q69_00036059 [Brassica cretica]|uniref:Uncharacterized protein n=1 Tax=Brassica cretica TaxID=69181 RepID=A0A8S9SU47_BRACR|nr:hypothetical protein F2Q69_00036059 [Brassica cretica]
MEMLKYSGDRKNYHHCRFSTSRSPPKWKRLATEQQQRRPPSELDLSLIPTFPIQTTAFKEETRRPETPSMYSEESVTTTTFPDSTAGERFVLKIVEPDHQKNLELDDRTRAGNELERSCAGLMLRMRANCYRGRSSASIENARLRAGAKIVGIASGG